jgi:uncharacterized protein (TIGR03435 family)
MNVAPKSNTPFQTKPATPKRSLRYSLFFLATCCITAATPTLLATPCQAQAATPQASAATATTAVPAWQTAAGGKMSFEVASIRENREPPSPSNPYFTNFPLGATPLYSHSGVAFVVRNINLVGIIDFAYYLTGMQGQSTLVPQLPSWALHERFNIEARAEAGTEPTKDQMRLMVQSLLADRFKLAVHTEMREKRVYALRQIEPGKLGTQIKPHPADFPCTTVRTDDLPQTGPPPIAADGLPQQCGYVRTFPDSTGPLQYSGRATPINEIAKLMTVWKADGVPVIDQTGLTGTYDLHLTFAPENERKLPAGDLQFGCYGPELEQAMKKQLGLKLVSTKAPIETLVIDHIEQPSAN